MRRFVFAFVLAAPLAWIGSAPAAAGWNWGPAYGYYGSGYAPYPHYYYYGSRYRPFPYYGPPAYHGGYLSRPRARR